MPTDVVTRFPEVVMMDVFLTAREYELMEILWDRGSATVAEVREAMGSDLARNTVLTFLRRLEGKGHVRHEEEGQAHRYFPVLGRGHATTGALQRLTKALFRGSRELLLTHLVSDGDLHTDELRRVRDLLDQRLTEDREC